MIRTRLGCPYFGRLPTVKLSGEEWVGIRLSLVSGFQSLSFMVASCRSINALVFASSRS